jgi:hypothetical protein
LNDIEEDVFGEEVVQVSHPFFKLLDYFELFTINLLSRVDMDESIIIQHYANE